MKNILLFIVVLMGLNAGNIEYQDYFGKHSLKQTPKRVIYLSTHLEVPAMLGIWDRVVGISGYGFKDDVIQATAPLKQLERFPSDHYAGINIERLKKMNVDFVVTYPADLKSIEFAKRFGIDFLALRTQSIDGLLNDLKIQADIFGVQKVAYPRIQAIQKALDEIHSYVLKSKNRPKVMEVFYKPNQISGKKSMDSDILRFAGVENLGEHYISQGRSEVNLENIIKENPEIIFIWWLSPLSVDDLLKDKHLSLVNAIKNKQVYKLPPIDIASPRTPLIALFIAMKSHPEVFSDFNLKGFLTQYYRDVFGIDPIFSGFF